jgi:hypothetical protein
MAQQIRWGFSMNNENARGERPPFDDEYDLMAVLDYPRVGLMAPAPGGLARLMRAVEAVRED